MNKSLTALLGPGSARVLADLERDAIHRRINGEHAQLTAATQIARGLVLLDDDRHAEYLRRKELKLEIFNEGPGYRYCE
jgi:predicted nucleic acid-binding protein